MDRHPIFCPNSPVFQMFLLVSNGKGVADSISAYWTSVSLVRFEKNEIFGLVSSITKKRLISSKWATLAHINVLLTDRKPMLENQKMMSISWYDIIWRHYDVMWRYVYCIEITIQCNLSLHLTMAIKNKKATIYTRHKKIMLPRVKSNDVS